MESPIGHMLVCIAVVSHVRDTATVAAELHPASAATLVELGLALTGIRMALKDFSARSLHA